MIFKVGTMWTFHRNGSPEVADESFAMMSFLRKSAHWDRHHYGVNFRWWRYPEWSER